MDIIRKSVNGSIARTGKNPNTQKAYEGFKLGGKKMHALVRQNKDYIEGNRIDVSTNIFYKRIAEREIDNILSDTPDLSRTENIMMVFRDTGDVFVKRTGNFIMHEFDVKADIGEFGFNLLKRKANIVEFDIRDVVCIYEFMRDKGHKYAEHAYSPGNIPFLLGMYFKEVKNV